jgi:hypothetical protein
MGWTTPTDRATGYVVSATDWNIVEDDLSFLYGDTGWTNVASFTNSWGAGSPAPAYMLIGRVVYLRGTLTAGTANTAAFTLPSGYRPSAAMTIAVASGSSGTDNNLAFATSGTVTPVTSTTTSCVCSFPIV